MSTKDVAPESVQEFRRTVRKSFRRGVNEVADHVIDELIVWLIDDVFSGKIETQDEAAKRVGFWFSKTFPGNQKRSARLVRRR